MTTPQTPDALLVGGPRDGTLFAAEDASSVELEIDGLVQRYLRTDQEQQQQGATVVVFAYDGVSDAAGTQAEVEASDQVYRAGG
ncbi:hypothetical protein ACIBF5_28825 [Micromonospora sp. NPDC050417]|uniref:hypothetical protein n=1 Tax=Micromonospora sp. NPDC050417 TaxID=3364280 RepID=UPI0037940605